MKQKIATFEEYDRVRARREEAFDKVVASKLEQLVQEHPEIATRRKIKNIDEGKKKIPEDASTQILFNQIRTYYEISDKEYNLLVEQIRNEITAKHGETVRRETLCAQVKENIAALTSCGAVIAMPTGYLSDEQKAQLAERFFYEFRRLGADNAYNTDFTKMFQRIAQLVQREEEEAQVCKKYKLLLRELQDKKLVNKETARDLYDLIFNEQPEERQRTYVPAVPVTHISDIRNGEEKKIAPAKKRDPEQERREALDYMTIIFGLSETVAAEYAAKVSPQELEYVEQQLRSVFSEEEIIQAVNTNPNIILYHTEKMLTKYVSTIAEVQTMLRRNSARRDLAARNLDQHSMRNAFEVYTDFTKITALKKELYEQLQPQSSHASL